MGQECSIPEYSMEVEYVLDFIPVTRSQVTFN